jgi:hypothetical protein
MKVKPFSVPAQGYNTSTVAGREQLNKDLKETLHQKGVQQALGFRSPEQLDSFVDNVQNRLHTVRVENQGPYADFLLTRESMQDSLRAVLNSSAGAYDTKIGMEDLASDYFSSDEAESFDDTNISRGQLLVLLSVLGGDDVTMQAAQKKLNPDYSPIPADAQNFLQSHIQEQGLAFALLK